ncbi:MAG: hypothetical protein RL885_11115 [Planctomycetota bacterium]
MDTERLEDSQGGTGETKDRFGETGRRGLQEKLSCLIAVLEVAVKKIRLSMDLPGGARSARLGEVCTRLETILTTCCQAYASLDEVASASVRAGQLDARDNQGVNMADEKYPEREKQRPERKMTYRDYVEFSSLEEFHKFRDLPEITEDDVAECDINDLLRKLIASEGL